MYADVPVRPGHAAGEPTDPAELVLNRSRRPQIMIDRHGGDPRASATPAMCSGPIPRPSSARRIPPTLDGDRAAQVVTSLLERDPPYGCKVSFTPEKAATGWHAPALAPWLAASIERASLAEFGAARRR